MKPLDLLIGLVVITAAVVLAKVVETKILKLA